MKLGRVGRLVCVCAWTIGWSMPALAVAQTPAAPAVTPPAAAPSAAPESASAGGEADCEALRQLRATYETAIRDNTIDAVGPLLHDDFHGVMVTGRAVSGLQGLKQVPGPTSGP